MSIYTWFLVHADFAEIKFQDTISTSTLVNANFTLYDVTPATPIQISTPFKTIDVSRDYYSISRSLNLWFNSALTPDKEYEIRISGLKTVIGGLIASDVIRFSSGPMTDLPTYEPPTRDVMLNDVEDYSIKDVSSLVLSMPAGDQSTLVVESIVPGDDVSYYLAPSATEGRIDIKFNQSPAANYVSSDYFKVQRKLVGRSLTRWEDVDALITADTENNYVYIYLPSTDATPVYGEPDKVYWETGYKYRVRISSGIGI